MRWKTCRTFVALTCALAVLVIAMKTPAAASETMSSAQTTAMFDKTQIDKVEFKVIAMAPGALAGGFALEPYATLAQIKAGDVVVTKKMLMDELLVAKIRQPLTLTEVATTAFVMKEPFLVSSTFTQHSDEMKLAGFTLARTPTAFVLRC